MFFSNWEEHPKHCQRHSKLDLRVWCFCQRNGQTTTTSFKLATPRCDSTDLVVCCQTVRMLLLSCRPSLRNCQCFPRGQLLHQQQHRKLLSGKGIFISQSHMNKVCYAGVAQVLARQCNDRTQVR